MVRLERMLEQNVTHKEHVLSSLSVFPQFYTERCVGLLGLDASQLTLQQAEEFAKKLMVFPKNEFHVTILGSQAGREIQQALKLHQESEEKLKKAIQESFLSQEWGVYLQPDLYFVQKEYFASPNEEHTEHELRKSIIQRVDVPQLSNFYTQLKAHFNITLPLPYPHITLFTDSTNPHKKLRGIGIDSYEDFQKLNPLKLN